MIDQYIELFHAFQQQQYSRVVSQVKEKILQRLRGGFFSPRLKSYFQSSLEPGEDSTAPEPEQVLRIKKVLKALTLIEMLLKEAEKIERQAGLLDWIYLACDQLYRRFNELYEAAELATQVSADTMELFGEALSSLRPIMTSITELTKPDVMAGPSASRPLNSKMCSQKIGFVSGVAVAQMNSQDGGYDYEFLTNFTAVLPEYLDQVSQCIQRYASHFSAGESRLDKQRQEDLQNDARQLLSSLDRLQHSSFFTSQKLYHLIQIIRRTVTLITAVLEQAGYLNEDLEQVLRDKLAELKYQILLKAISYTDQIEIDLMLAPGTLSSPLKNSLEDVYRFLVYYVEKIVDFTPEDRPLQVLDESHFSELRADSRHQSIAELNAAILKIEMAQNFAGKFFAILKKNQYANQRLSTLPERTKQILLRHYKMIAPYVAQMNPEMNDVIISSLTEKQSMMTRLTDYMISPEDFRDNVQSILAVKKPLKRQLEKEIQSHGFRRQLTIDQIDAMSACSSGILVMDDGPRNLFFADEQLAFDEEESMHFVFEASADGVLLKDLSGLGSEQVLKLYQFYEYEHSKLETAQEAWCEFYGIVSALDHSVKLCDLPQDKKQSLHRLFFIMAPYLKSALAEDPDFPVWLRAVFSALSDDRASEDRRSGSINSAIFNQLKPHIERSFKQNDEQYHARIKEITIQFRLAASKETQEKSIVQSSEHVRAAYLVKKNQYYENISQLRQKLKSFSNLFNEPVTIELSFARERGLPFPEAEEIILGVPQSSQVLTLKRLYNGLYYLEQFFSYLENLRGDEYKIVYIGKSTLVFYQLGMLVSTVLDILDDPYLGTLAHDLIENLKNTYQTASHLIDPYIAGQFIPDGAEQPIERSSIYYTLNALMIMPEHIQTLLQGQDLPSERVEALQKQTDVVSAKIQRLINQSHSYFKMFLATPSIYRLFKELKAQLKRFTDVAHHAVLDHLQEMNEVILTELLMEADLWEDRLSLKPGLISGELKVILDEFYHALLMPLGLPSKRHLELAMNRVPLEKRRRAVQLRLEDAQTQRNSALEILTDRLHPLMGAMQTYKGYLANEVQDEIVEAHLRSILLERYAQALPILEQEKGRFSLTGISYIASSTWVDEILQSEHEEGASLHHIEKLLELTMHYFEGLSATHQCTMKASEEKIAYLETLDQSQLQKNEQFIEEYTSEALNKQMLTLCQSNFGFVYLQQEYQKKLAAHIESNCELLIASAQQAEDIQAQISVLLEGELRAFKDTYHEGYQHLERIRIQIAEFKLYLAQSNKRVSEKRFCYESAKTLSAKQALINSLEIMIHDETKSPSERIECIVGEVQKPVFKTIMLDYHHYEVGTFKWIWQWITSLFKTLFTGFEHQKNYHQLKQVITETSAQSTDLVPDTQHPRKRFHFFPEDPQQANASEEVLSVVPIHGPQTGST